MADEVEGFGVDQPGTEAKASAVMFGLGLAALEGLLLEEESRFGVVESVFEFVSIPWVSLPESEAPTPHSSPQASFSFSTRDSTSGANAVDVEVMEKAGWKLKKR